MSARTATWLAWGLWVVSVALTALFLLLYFLNRSTPFESGPGPRGTDAADAMALLAFPTVGALIASRRPDNPIGWIFCTAGLALAVSVSSSQYAHYTLLTKPGSLPGGEWMAWLNSWLFFPSEVLPRGLLLLIFPTGALLSPRWRPLAWLAVGSTAVASLGVAFSPGSLDDPSLQSIENPLGIEGGAVGILEAVGGFAWLLLLPITLAAATSLVLRFRRAKGEERQQIKWVASAAGLLAATQLASALAYDTSTVAETIIAVLGTAALVSIPIATGVAILRYRLYDIDRIINRTLVYGLLTGALGLTYFGGVVGLQAASRPVTGGSGLAIALTTLVVAVLFLPARLRVQDTVDRRFNRRAYDAARTIEAFSARLREQIDLDTLRYELLAVVDETMQPAAASLWLRTPEARR